VPVRLNIFIEEAHGFLSAERIKQMPNLFDQVARIARRGRKRYEDKLRTSQGRLSDVLNQDLGALNNMLRRANLPNVVTQTPRRSSNQ
jgi:hypothetical protein